MTYPQRSMPSRTRRRSRFSRITCPLRSEQLETRMMLAADLLQNPDLATDVNADGYTSPMDALQVINELNTRGARSLRSEVRTAAEPCYFMT